MDNNAPRPHPTEGAPPQYGSPQYGAPQHGGQAGGSGGGPGGPGSGGHRRGGARAGGPAGPGGPGSGWPGFGGPTYGKSVPNAGKGFAIAGFSTGVAALLLSWIPFVNVLALVLGLAALGLAIPAVLFSVKHRSRFRALSIGALALAVLSLIAVPAVQDHRQEVINDRARAIIEDEKDGVRESSEEEREAAAAAQPIELGTAVQVVNYKVTITDVNTDAYEEILELNSSMEEPQGQYVLIDMTVDYSGEFIGTAYLEVDTQLMGADGRQYNHSSCDRLGGTDVMYVPPLEKGDTAEFQICMDVPPEALTDAKIYVEPGSNRHEKVRTYWSVP